MPSSRILLFSSLFFLEMHLAVAILVFYRRRHLQPMRHMPVGLIIVGDTALLVFMLSFCIFRIFQEVIPAGIALVVIGISLNIAADSKLLIAIFVRMAFQRSGEILAICQSGTALKDISSSRLKWAVFFLQKKVLYSFLLFKGFFTLSIQLVVIWNYPELMTGGFYQFRSADRLKAVSVLSLMITAIIGTLLLLVIQKAYESLGITRALKENLKAAVIGSICTVLLEGIQGVKVIPNLPPEESFILSTVIKFFW